MKKIIIYIVLVTVAAAAFSWYLNSRSGKEEEKKPVDAASMPVIIWDKECKYQNSLKCADILSPVLFRMDENGDFLHLSSKEFTDSVEIEIWGVFTNGFDPDITREIMQDAEKRSSVCDKIVSLCTEYEIEGANIDFENMYSDDRELFSEFIKELSEKLHETGKILSVDVTKINRGSMFYSMCYDRAVISKYADFVILMGYDQYPRTSEVAGPVSGINWVENAISDMLSEVPTEKFILGIPFYTRLWEQKDGTVISSKAISMTESENIKIENGLTANKDESGLDYFEFNRDESKFSVWQENESSLKSRIELAKKYRLKGIACWCLGFENEKADEILSEI